MAIKYAITQDGIEAFRTKYSKPQGSWEDRYAHILLNDFQTLHEDGLTKAEISALYGTIGIAHFETLHRKGYFRAMDTREVESREWNALGRAYERLREHEGHFDPKLGVYVH